jgi:predicted TIM-barrel fold metal-dependent hydrolase
VIVDFQHHFTPNLKDPPGPRTIYSHGIPISTRRPGLGRVEPHIEFMDKVGIDVAVLTAPMGMRGELKLARAANDGLAETCRKYPDRFRFLAHTAPLDGVEGLRLASRWLDECPGAVMASAFGEAGPDDPRLERFYSLLEDKGKYLFVHAPIGISETEAKLYSGYDIFRTVGREFSLVMATMRLVFGGVFDRHPRLRVVMAHLGGGIAPLVDRIENYQDKEAMGVAHDPLHGKTSKKPFKHYLGRMYFDTAGVYGSLDALRSALFLVPRKRIVFGTDYPQEIRRPEQAKRMLEALKKLGMAENGNELLHL